MNNIINCEQLDGRVRDICRGHDSSGEPIKMTGEKRWAYIQKWIELKKIDPISVSKEEFIADHNKHHPPIIETETKTAAHTQLTTTTKSKGCGCGKSKQIKDKIAKIIKMQ